MNIAEFVKQFNDRMRDQMGMINLPISGYKDRSFDFILKSPPRPCPQEGGRRREGRR